MSNAKIFISGFPDSPIDYRNQFILIQSNDVNMINSCIFRSLINWGGKAKISFASTYTPSYIFLVKILSEVSGLRANSILTGLIQQRKYKKVDTAWEVVKSLDIDFISIKRNDPLSGFFEVEEQLEIVFLDPILSIKRIEDIKFISSLSALAKERNKIVIAGYLTDSFDIFQCIELLEYCDHLLLSGEGGFLEKSKKIALTNCHFHPPSLGDYA